jgi:RNA polymerase sigma-70 factor (ECF subfamily)
VVTGLIAAGRMAGCPVGVRTRAEGGCIAARRGWLMLGRVESDADLVLRLRKGDQAAFAALVDRYHSRLTRFARSFTARPELAEDIAQETWLGLLRGLEGFEGRASLRTWLFQICANRARTLAAKEGRLVPVDPTDPDSPTVDPARFDAGGGWTQPPVPWSEEAADDADLVERVRAAIHRLPETQQQVVTLRDVEGLSALEVCRILELTEGNQRVLLHRGRARVRAILEKEVTAR